MEFYDVSLKQNFLLLSDGTKKAASPKETEFFKLRPKLKAVKNKDGTIKIIRWADLHRHSGYSLLDGAISIDNMVKHTEYAGAITDHGNMRGTLEYFKAMEKAKKFPIIGEEFYVENMDGKLANNHLILLAKTYKGYKNLCKLSKGGYEHMYRKHPHITRELIKEYHEDVICLSACISGEVPQLLGKDYDQKALEAAQWYQSVFGEDYYIEIQRHNIPIEKVINPKLEQLAKRIGSKLVATTDAHYVNKEDDIIHDVILCIGTKSKLTDPKRMKFSGEGYHLQTADEMEKRFKDIPKTLDTTLEILEKCKDFTIVTGNIRTPVFAIPKPYKNDSEYFEHLCRTGLKKRIPNTPQNYKDRLEYEINVIEHMKYCGYFLIVQDFINFAKNNNIPVGLGRGSAAGSLVACAMNITDIDPIKYGLLFERFLNEDRVSYPDIDSDFSKKDRPKVLEYVKNKYGSNCVSKIIDITRLMPRNAVRDVARVMGYPYNVGDKISKAIPDSAKTLKNAMDTSPELQELYKQPEVKRIFDTACKIEGLPRGVSVHACGVLIAPSDVSDFMPQEIATDRETGEKVWVTQYPGPQCEEMGLLKMDFLGLRTLDVIDSACHNINEYEGVKVTFSQIPINDPKIYMTLKNGKTSGVFQLESQGMTNMLHEMYYDVSEKDTEEKGNEYFDRLIAAVALYRPGPMDEIPHYIEAMKSGKIKYDVPQLENILKSTYGILVYQEQIMFAVRALAGFSKGQSDNIRRAMGKKHIDEMLEFKKYFLYGSKKHDMDYPDKPINIKGCVPNGIDENTAKNIWNKMEKFASYAFNKSHACAYATIAAKTAWLVTYYPVEFSVGVLNSCLDKADKLHKYLEDVKQGDIPLLPPDINKSKSEFSIEYIAGKKGIRFGLNGIANLGCIVADEIEKERQERGTFKSFDNFIERIGRFQKFDKTAYEALVYSGALDLFPCSRAAKLGIEDKVLNKISLMRKTNYEQLSIFEMLGGKRFDPIQMPDKTEYHLSYLAMKEEELLGIVFHCPTVQYRKIMNESGADLIGNLKSRKSKAKFVGMVKNVIGISYKHKGKPARLLNFEMEDESGTITCIVYGNLFDTVGVNIRENTVCYVMADIVIDGNYGLQAIVKKSYPMSCYDKRKEIKKSKIRQIV